LHHVPGGSGRVSGLLKLIHPDGDYQKAELAEYLHFALEMRRRVKEQLRRINPDEFRTAELSFLDKETGSEVVLLCPEYREPASGSDGFPLSSNLPGTSRILPADRSIEVFHGYELLQALQAGGMAEAYRARDAKTGRVVFLKRVRTQSSDKVALERETRIYEKLMRTCCQHVLQVLDFVRIEDHVAIITEFADGGDLNHHVSETDDGSGLTPAEAKEIGLAIATAIRDLHAQKIVHRDLKPGNVLNASGQWKLTDSGISKNLNRLMTQKTLQQHGTLGYAPPKQFQNRRKGSGVVFGQAAFRVVDRCPKTFPDPVALTCKATLIDKKLLAGCLLLVKQQSVCKRPSSRSHR
jgi:serine/threonine protein kinase